MTERPIQRKHNQRNYRQVLPRPEFLHKMAHQAVSLPIFPALNYFTYITTENHRLTGGNGTKPPQKFTVLSQIRHLSVNFPHYN